MKSMIEDVSIEKLGIILDVYNQENEISIDYSLLTMLNKGKEKLYNLYLEGIELKIIVRKISTFSGISAYDILEIFPLEASYILSYIVNNTNVDKSTKIKVLIYDESKHISSLYADALNTATNINLTFDDNTISPVAMDKYYKVNKTFVSDAKKTFFGTMLGIRSSEYFQCKKNETNFPLDIQNLEGNSKNHLESQEETERKRKNYLKPKENELLIIYCPICKEQKKFVYAEINEYFNIAKEEVTIVCSHNKSKHMYEKPPHKIEIEQEIMAELKKRRYQKEDIFMYIINNRKPFGLFRK